LNNTSETANTNNMFKYEFPAVGKSLVCRSQTSQTADEDKSIQNTQLQLTM